MRYFAAAFVVSTLLSGCGGNPVTLPYKHNVTKAVANKEMLDCEVKAANVVPSNISTYTTPKRTTPVQCETDRFFGNVSCSGGQTFGGNTVSRDLNANLRNRYIEQCLMDKGYSMLSYPHCSYEIQRAAIKARKATVVNPEGKRPLIGPDENICAFVHQGKTWYADINDPTRSL